MRDACAFDNALFLGLAGGTRRDPYRLGLFAQHLEPDEEPLVFLPVQGGTLVVTDGRLLEMRAHLDDHGAWNVKEFQGYAIHRTVDRASVHDLTHAVRRSSVASASHRIEDRLLLRTAAGIEEILVSRGPDGILSEEDFRALRDAVLGRQPK